MRRCVAPRTPYLASIRPSPTTTSLMRLKTRPAVDWKAACMLLSGVGGQDNASDGGIHRKRAPRSPQPRKRSAGDAGRSLALLTVVLQKQLSNAADAEDAVQDALLSAYKLRPIQRAGANVDMVNRHSRRHWRVPCPTL